MDSIQKQVLSAFAEAFIQLGESLKKINFEEENPKRADMKVSVNDAELKNLPPFLTMLELGEILKIPRRRLYEEIDSMGIPHKKLSPRRIRIPRDGFLKWLESNEGVL